MIGLLFVFLLGLLAIIFNCYQFHRNFRLSYYYQETFLKNNDFLEMNNFDYLYDKNVFDLKQKIMKQRLNKRNYPKSLALVIVSAVDYKSIYFLKFMSRIKH